MSNKYRAAIFFITAILISAGMASALETPFNYSDSNTALQVSDFTIPVPNGSYVGAIKIFNIDPTKITRITVTADTYTMDINITTTTYGWGWLSVSKSSISSNFIERLTNRSESHTITEIFPGTEDSLYLPWYANSLGDLQISNDRIYWSKNDQRFASQAPLLNTPFNSSNTSNVLLILPSPSVTVSVMGSDKIDITYYTGSAEKAQQSSVNIQILDSTESWFDWIVSHIPFIGPFVLSLIKFLTSFFSLAIDLFLFFLTDFDIIVLTYFTGAMIHGIVVMGQGGNPFDGVLVLVIDIVTGITFTVSMVIQVSMLVWGIVLAIATATKMIYN